MSLCYCDGCSWMRRDEPAEAAARALLAEWVDPAEHPRLEYGGPVTAVGGISGRTYAVEASTVRCGEVSFCIVIGNGYQPYGDPCDFPTCDVVLAKKLMIEADERLFLETAECSHGEHHPYARLP